jgi:8-oxo-dGTP diphosphatase
MKTVKVVGAVIINENGEILCALRSANMSMPNLWEFPGGKIQGSELPETALVREIHEELGCRLKIGSLLKDITYEYPTITVNLLTYLATIQEGEPIALEHAEIRWLRKDKLAELEWAPADLPTVETLISCS